VETTKILTTLSEFRREHCEVHKVLNDKIDGINNILYNNYNAHHIFFEELLKIN
jgi:hypothetical protein